MGLRHHRQSLVLGATALVAVVMALADAPPFDRATRGAGDGTPAPPLASARATDRTGAAHATAPSANTDVATRVALDRPAPRTLELHGRVVDETAAPIEGATVRLCAPSSGAPDEAPGLARIERRGALAGRLLLDPSIPPAALGVLVRDGRTPEARPEFVALDGDGSFACAELQAGSYTVEAVLHDDWFGADWDAETGQTALPLACGAADVEPQRVAIVAPLDLRGRLHAIRLHVRRAATANVPARCFYGSSGGAPASRALAWIGADDASATLVTTALPIDVELLARALPPMRLERIAADVTIELDGATEAIAERPLGSGE